MKYIVSVFQADESKLDEEGDPQEEEILNLTTTSKSTAAWALRAFANELDPPVEDKSGIAE